MDIVEVGGNRADARFGPEPVVVNLAGREGLALREQALEQARAALARGGEAGSVHEQATGKLAEIVIRRLLPGARDPVDLGHDMILPAGPRVDSKCRGGRQPFRTAYEASRQRRAREAKHNLFAGQIHGGDPTRGGRQATAHIYVLSHLHMPANREFPGTARQRNWVLFVCGWVSAERAARAVYLPRGSITEQGRTWFAYRGEEIEFYHRNLRPVWIEEDVLQPLSTLTLEDVAEDARRDGDMHITSVDYDRVVADLRGLGIWNGPCPDVGVCEPILSPNQYWHVAEHLDRTAGGQVDREKLRRYVGDRIRYRGGRTDDQALPGHAP